MKYDSDFNIADIFTNKKYRARFILVLYFIFFLFIMIISRNSLSTGEVNVDNKDEKVENLNSSDDATTENMDMPKQNETIYPGFEYINMNNYSFEYVLSLNNQEYTAKGKRFNNKFSFTMQNNDEEALYIIDGNIASVKKDNEFVNTNIPYYYFNYYDSSVLQKILLESKLVDGELKVSNDTLSKYIDKSFNYKNNNPLLVNDIKLTTKNGKIVQMDFDLSNLFKDVDELKTLKLSLKYDDFGLIDDFELKN